MLLMRQAKGPCLGGKRAAPAPPGGGGHGVQANSQGAPLPGGGLGARSIGRGVSDAPGSLQACTGWSSPWRPCRRREEAESLGAAQGGEGGAGGSGLPRAWVQQASLAGSRGQAAGDGGPVSQAAPGKKSGAPGVLGMGEGMEAWGHGCYQSVVVGLSVCPPHRPNGQFSPHHRDIKECVALSLPGAGTWSGQVEPGGRYGGQGRAWVRASNGT